MTNQALPTEWQYYADRARDAHTASCDPLAAGREEQLDKILASIATGRDFTPAVVARLERLPWNRAKKHRRFDRTLRQRESVRERTALRPPHSIGEFPTLDAEHFRVEGLLIAGESYPVIARRMATTVAALKMRVVRWRRAIRATQAE